VRLSDGREASGIRVLAQEQRKNRIRKVGIQIVQQMRVCRPESSQSCCDGSKGRAHILVS
jgi:hypothetical protein